MMLPRNVFKTLVFVLCCFACIAPGFARAEVVRLKDGTVIAGHTAAKSAVSFYFVPDDETQKPRWISLADVESLQLDAVPVSVLNKRREAAEANQKSPHAPPSV
ncbi:MAG TPA: hypothetical protein VL688_07015 [Verrucomicrobiae bacterium]|jgi:hypothetical protein|nr:hypothetical protein [Verrucomicrobiae bacterium]